jgi:hypothetical protein
MYGGVGLQDLFYKGREEISRERKRKEEIRYEKKR